jgi:hypothetical protein
MQSFQNFFEISINAYNRGFFHSSLSRELIFLSQKFLFWAFHKILSSDKIEQIFEMQKALLRGQPSLSPYMDEKW